VRGVYARSVLRDGDVACCTIGSDNPASVTQLITDSLSEIENSGFWNVKCQNIAKYSVLLFS